MRFSHGPVRNNNWQTLHRIIPDSKVGFCASKGQSHFDNLLFTNSQAERSLYTLGNQTIATRVSGDPVSANNGLFYIFSDHLGSTSVLAAGGGTEVPGSRARYYPFGSPRTAPTQTITDRNFTGQKENLELGLIYFNARYYLPTLARFLTPDTLVPDPQNPQQFNRYTYVLNNPLRFIDPSGRFCYDPLTNQFSDGDCYDNQQEALIDYLIGLLGHTSDLEIAQLMLIKSLQLISNPVASLRAITEIFRNGIDMPGTWGWEFNTSKFYYKNILEERNITWVFDDSGFGDLSDPVEANQISHFIGIAYISAYQQRENPNTQGAIMAALIRGNEWQHIGEQSAHKTDVEIDLAEIAVQMGKDLVVAQVPEEIPWYARPYQTIISQAIVSISTYNYATAHPLQNAFDNIEWP